MSNNPYMPKKAEIFFIREEVTGERSIKTFRTRFLDGNGDGFQFQSGQCAMLSVFGKGESMISISSSPNIKEYLQFSILKTGRVTSALHDIEEGNLIGIRGPYGNKFPIDEWQGKNILFIGGGIGLAPLWSVLHSVLHKKDNYKDISLIYGARSATDLVYKEEYNELRKKINLHLSVDKQEDDWKEFVGFVPQNLQRLAPSHKNTIAVTCGPPIMIKFVIKALTDLEFDDEQIFTTVENKMKCGIGKCGRCNIGSHYICKDGPVYTWSELKKLPQEY